MGARDNKWARFTLVYWRAIATVLTPLLLLPLPLVSGTEAARTGYIILIMAVYWMLDLLPLAVTALIPVAVFPMIGIMSTGDISMYYLKSSNMLFLAGEPNCVFVSFSNILFVSSGLQFQISLSSLATISMSVPFSILYLYLS